MKNSRIIWDSTNIGENYPGITAPLTYSFIKDAYATVYENFLKLIGVPEKQIRENKFIMHNMLGYIKGRVYYNIENWYRFLTFLPGYRYNKEFFEKMLDPVEKKKSGLESKVKLGHWNSLKVLITFIFHILFFSKLHNIFEKEFDKIYNSFKKIKLPELSNTQLVIMFEDIQSKFFIIWAITIINDFKVMIVYGLLNKIIEKSGNDPEIILRDIYSLKNKPRSVVPLERITEIVSLIKSKEVFLKLFKKKDSIILKELSDNKYVEISKLINSYLQEFGDRSANELKLEEPKFKEKPELFISLIKQYLTSHQSLHSNKKDHSFNNQGIHFINMSLVNTLIMKFLKDACVKVIYQREYFRIQRGKAFGIAREMFLEIGERLQRSGDLVHKDDIFFLYKSEILNYLQFHSLASNFNQLVESRKQLLNTYQNLSLSKRIITDGLLSENIIEQIHSKKILALTGKGTSKGKVKGECIVIEKLDFAKDYRNKILVTTATDPGWTVIFPLLKGVITEQGGTLSHASIIARELGIPCIVQVQGVTQKLSSGQQIEMDALKGVITLQS